MKKLKECITKELHTIVVGNDHVSDNVLKLTNTITGEVCFIKNTEDFVNNIPLSFVDKIGD